eukprot:CAMPEP_0195519076 /NCGR_PEP_ID=MMETSP0794_2-20130614/14326_1 /TAXON_ID=515487 /ORGANISM="Stephanopyxis turris, Strain CCMP 815" /LENGTH=397 /DNA_ID=CAMNT_0040648173 /DNA_START=121 /DNA_END=1314 /DNA_ORIENTATION=+
MNRSQRESAGKKDISSNRPNTNGKDIGFEKRRKYQEKQNRKNAAIDIQRTRREWVERHSSFVTWLTDKSLIEQRKSKGRKRKRDAVIETEEASISDLLDPYTDLKEGNAQDGNTFVAEGTEAVRLLIQQSANHKSQVGVKVHSILVKPCAFFEKPVRLLDDVMKAMDEKKCPPFHVIIASESVMSSLAGFHIARGAMACGYIPQRDEAWLKAYLTQQQTTASAAGTRILALDKITDTANLGSMIRCAAAFGVLAVVLSHDSCNAWYRRSVRVSMGHIFSIPTIRVENLANFITDIQKNHQFTSYAAVIDPHADIVLENLQHQHRETSKSNRWCCVMGNEANGICERVVNACSNTIRIDMAMGVDSLSVPVATGILLHGLRAAEKRSEADNKQSEISE